jgi:hypothetical protein
VRVFSGVDVGGADVTGGMLVIVTSVEFVGAVELLVVISAKDNPIGPTNVELSSAIVARIPSLCIIELHYCHVFNILNFSSTVLRSSRIF